MQWIYLSLILLSFYFLSPGLRMLSELETISSEASALYTDKKYDEAVKKYLLILKERDLIPSGKETIIINTLYSTGACYYYLKDYDTAINYFLQLRTDFPDTDKAKKSLHMLGSAYIKKADYDTAIKSYEEILIQNQDDTEIYIDSNFQISFCYQKKKEFAKSTEIIEMVRNKYTDYQSSLLNQNCDYLNYLIQLDSGNASLSYMLGEQIIHQSTTPWTNEVRFRMANNLYDDKKFTDAMGYYLQVSSRAAMSELINTLTEEVKNRKEYTGGDSCKTWELSTLTYLAKRTETDPDLLPRAIYQIGKCYFSLGDYTTAKKVYEEIKVRFPEETEIIQRLDLEFALCYLKEDRLELFKQTIAKIQLADQRFYLLQELHREKMYDVIIQQYELGKFNFDEDEFKPIALFMVGDTYYSLEKYDLAIQLFTELVDKYPKSDQKNAANYKIGQCYVKLKQYEQALPIWLDLLTTYPEQELEINHMLVITYFNMKEFVKTIEFSDRFITKFAGSEFVPESMYYKGSALMSLKQLDESLLCFKEIVVKYPQSERVPYVHYNIAMVYYQQEKFDLMRDVVLQLEKEFPQIPYIHAGAKYWLGWYEENYGSVDTAMNKYREILGKYPEESWAKEARLGLGRTYSKMGQYKQAETEYVMALDKWGLQDKDFLLQVLDNLNIAIWKSRTFVPGVKLYKQLIQKYTTAAEPGDNILFYLKFKLALIYYYLGNDKETATLYKLVLPKLPVSVFNAQDRYTMADAFFNNADYPLALENYVIYISSLPKEGYLNEAVRGVAGSYLKLKTPTAEKSLTNSITQYPETKSIPEVNYALAEIEKQKKSYRTAIPYYEEAVGKLADDEMAANALFGLAISYQNLARYKEAALCYKRIEIIHGYYEDLAAKARVGFAECNKRLGNKL